MMFFGRIVILFSGRIRSSDPRFGHKKKYATSLHVLPPHGGHPGASRDHSGAQYNVWQNSTKKYLILPKNQFLVEFLDSEPPVPPRMAPDDTDAAYGSVPASGTPWRARSIRYRPRDNPVPDSTKKYQILIFW